MPVNIAVGILGLLIALVVYSIAAIGAFRRKGFVKRDVVLLWVGVFFDILATVMMGLSVGGLDLRPGYPLVHTVLALAAFFGMLGGAIAASYALSKGDEGVSSTVAKWLLAPWLFWVAVFIEGMISRGAARMGG